MTAPTRYTLEELSNYDGIDGRKTWIAIYDMVYDVTEYKDKHPGGGELIEEYAGKDATEGFDDFGHSSDAKRTLKDFLVGELVEEDKKANRKKKVGNSIDAKAPRTGNRKKRAFLAVLCGKCTT